MPRKQFIVDQIASIIAAPTKPLASTAEADLPPIDQTPRARKTREILRIAGRYGWQSAIAHFLDTRNAEGLFDLSEPQLDDLLGRMHGYVDAVEHGCDPPDAPPAR